MVHASLGACVLVLQDAALPLWRAGQSFLVRQILLPVRVDAAETPLVRANLVRWLCTTKCCPALAEGRAVFPKVKFLVRNLVEAHATSFPWFSWHQSHA